MFIEEELMLKEVKYPFQDHHWKMESGFDLETSDFNDFALNYVIELLLFMYLCN